MRGVLQRLRRARVRAAVLVLTVVGIGAAALWAPSALTAGSTVGSFEIDGNTPDTLPGEPVDWDDAGTGTPPITVMPFTDLSNNANDDRFQGSSKEPDQSTWKCITNNVNDKNDIVNGAIGFRTLTVNGAPHQFAYMRFSRVGVNGTADLDFEFNKSAVRVAGCPAVGADQGLPVRSIGDILITFDVLSGGSNVAVNAYSWNGSGFTLAGNLVQGTTWDAASNAVTTGHEGNFGEAVLDLTATIGEISCGEFNSVYMKSKESSGVDSNAALSDRTQTQTVNVGACPSSSLAKAVRNATLVNGVPKQADFGNPPRTTTTADPGDTIAYRLTYTNGGTGTAHNVVITEPIPAHSTFDSCSNSCVDADTGLAPTSSTTKLKWTLGTVGPNTSIPVTFQVKLDSVFPSGPTPVTNIANVTTTEEPSPGKDSNPAIVNVTAAPHSVLAKAVRNATLVNGVPKQADFGNPPRTTTTADPGDTIVYRLTYTNTGNANATNVVITEPVPTNTTFVSCTGGCVDATTNAAPTSSTTSIKWNLGTVAPNSPQVLTFTVRLASVFPSGSTPVTNTAQVCTTGETCQNSNPTTVNVTAAPILALVKSANKTDVTTDDQITYTLTATNTGNANATNTVIKEDIPTGTQFASCSDGCVDATTNQTPTTSTTSVKWSIGTLNAPNGSKTVTLTVNVLGTVLCTITNTAKISSPDQNNGSDINSNPITINATPGPNPDGAHARDSAFAAHVQAFAINQTLIPVSSSQSGVGANSQTDSLLTVNVPTNGSLLAADVMRSSSVSRVTRTPAAADHVSTAETLGVKVLKVGTVYAVTADVVRASAETTATGTSASYTSAGSTIANLKVAGLAQNDIRPGLVVDLPDLVFGPNSYVAVDEETGAIGTPATGPPPQTSGGTYSADLEVNMIRVHLDDNPLTLTPFDPVDINVSHAKAHSDFPQTRLCHTAPTRATSGHAFVASETTDPKILPVLFGYEAIGTFGGSDARHLDSLAVGNGLLTTGVADTQSVGTIGSPTTAFSTANAANVCLLKSQGKCTIEATAVQSEANSTANGTTASSNDTGTQLVGLKVGGTSIPITPAPNTKITLPNIGFVVLNEQTCDNGGPANHVCGGTTHTGLRVRAIHVVVTKGALGLLPGAEVIVAEAESDATFSNS